MLTGQGGGSPCGVGCVFVISWLAAVAMANVAEPPLLTTAAAIARSDVSRDQTPPRVQLDAIVTHRDADGTIFLRDDTGSTFISRPPRMPRLVPGMRVRVEGVVHIGVLINGIREARIEPLGVGPPPEPKPITPQEMATGGLHYDWVSLEGVGRRWRRSGAAAGTLAVNVAGSIVEARLEKAPPDAVARGWIGARLRLTGLAAGEINDRRQLVRPYLLVPDSRAVAVIEPAPANPFALPEVTFADLGRGEPADGWQRISGIVATPPRAQRLFLTDGNRGLSLLLAADDASLAAPPVPGNRVEAVGFAERGPFATRLVEARLKIVATEEPPQPRRPSVGDMRAGCDAQVIQIEVPVLAREERAAGTLLVGDLEGISLKIFAPSTLAQEIVPSSRIRVTAPCLVDETANATYSLRARSYELFPVAVDDIVLVESPPWWTPRRLAVALAASLTVGGVALAWVVLLRRQVGRQLSLIERQIQQEAVAAERQRIAREFHDSLEQDLAGLALRIDSAAATVADPDARGTMERQRQILTRLQHETRQYVWDLREPARLQGSLADRVRALLAELRELVATPLTLEVAGSLPLLPPETTYQLLRMLREAVNNAAHHANATSITVGLAADGQGVVATVTDDGAGFEPAADGATPAGHFGLRGLTERAARIAADVQIASQPGQGTVVTIHVPQPG